jgi:NAD-dependent dihydropyrimidine dehydrogenase PreA subunit
MPIDPDFASKRKKAGTHSGHDVWGPVNPPKVLGIHGTSVAVDWDVCNGDGICAEVCPVNVFDMVDVKGHPTSDKKSDPAREPDCIKCLACELNCPTQAIKIEK